jgi:hypothetical protein
MDIWRTTDNLHAAVVISLNILFLQQELAPWFEHFLKDIQLEVPELWQSFVDPRHQTLGDIDLAWEI